MLSHSHYNHFSTLCKDGSSKQHTCGGQCFRNDRHRIMVHPVGASNLVQLEAEKDRWSTRDNDVHLGLMSVYGSFVVHLTHEKCSCCPFWRLRRGSGKTHDKSLQKIRKEDSDCLKNFNIPIQVQPQAFGALSLVSWAQILIYHK